MNGNAKVAVVTGAARGNGRAIAERLASDGAFVLCADIDEQALQRTVAEIQAAGGEAEGVLCDVSKEDDVERMMAAAERRGGPHAVVAQAGVFFSDDLIEDTDLRDWDRVMAVDLRGTFLCARAAIPRMRRLGGGSIVTMSGTNAISGAPGAGVTAAAKGAIMSLTRAIAVECGDGGIRCNCIVPGYIDTPMVADWLAAQPDPAAAREGLNKSQPLGRIAKTTDIAAMASFLCWDESAFCTGHPFIVDGGLSA